MRIDREIKPSRYKKKHTSDTGESVRQTVGISTIKAYKSALVNLYEYQKAVSSSGNNNPKPYGTSTYEDLSF